MLPKQAQSLDGNSSVPQDRDNLTVATVWEIAQALGVAPVDLITSDDAATADQG